MSPEPLLSYPEMGAPRITPDGIVSWGGVAMPAPRVYPKVPHMVFDAPGIGIWPVDGPSSRGDMDVTLVTGAGGSVRYICTLVNTGSSSLLTLGLGTTNQPLVIIHDVTGATIAGFNGSSVFASGVRLRIRLTWDSQEPSVGGQHAGVMLNGEAAPGTWTTPPTSSWTPFVVNQVNVGGLPPLASAFNGTLENAQLGLLYL